MISFIATAQVVFGGSAKAFEANLPSAMPKSTNELIVNRTIIKIRFFFMFMPIILQKIHATAYGLTVFAREEMGFIDGRFDHGCL
jgi:TRAP-type mannitol/chloroaromatic compound transport system permease large subunit